MAYDDENLYFAFYARDNEPDKIKTSITRRDNIIPEDWVGIFLDMNATRQSGYGFYSNPSGIQYDEYQTVNGEDYTPDWVWYNAAKIVEDGYVVEFRIPLKSISFQSGEDVPVNITFFRKISRLGYVTAWPEIKPSGSSLRSARTVTYGRLKAQTRIEVLPSVTYSNVWNRQAPDEWTDGKGEAEVGIGIKWGITSSVNAEVTINPDFSQVESDTFQVLVNQRYPVFFAEKRPFFMEISNQFAVARGFVSNMATVVHTRRIADPAWGARVMGAVGKVSFGLLAAGDEVPSESDTGDDNPMAAFVIGRAKYSLGGDNYIGAIFTDRETDNGYNRVVGADMAFNFADYHNIKINYLHSFSSAEFDSDSLSTEGGSFYLNYLYSPLHFQLDLYAEHVDKDFRMDTAFYNRTGFTRFMGFAGPKFYPEESASWIKRIFPSVMGIYLHETETGLDEYKMNLRLRIDFEKQAYAIIEYQFFNEAWAGRLFEGEYFQAQGGIQATKWLRLNMNVLTGDKILYDFNNPFVGKGTSLYLSTNIQFSDNLSQSLSYVYQDLNYNSSNEKVYDTNIISSRTTYQVNKYLFFRASVQYNSYMDVVLTDILASFTLIPGTVLHLGYGSLYENRYWAQDQWIQNSGLGELYQTTQSIFFKASYRWQY